MKTPTKKELQEQAIQREAVIIAIELEINALQKYLLSDKFHCGDELDGYVHVKDVLRYIDQLRTRFTYLPQE